MAETNFDEFKRKDCVFVANWLRTEGLHKLCSVFEGVMSDGLLKVFKTDLYLYLNIPEFLKTGLAKIRAHSTTWQLKAIKSVQRPIKKPICDAEP